MRRRGFSLIEVLLSLFLLAIGIATTAYMIPVATRGIARSKLTTQAAYFAQQRMEEALTVSGTPGTTVDPDVPDLTGEIQHVPLDGLTVTRVIVYKTVDPRRYPLVELESL